MISGGCLVILHIICVYVSCRMYNMCFILYNVTDYEQSVHISVLRLVVDV